MHPFSRCTVYFKLWHWNKISQCNILHMFVWLYDCNHNSQIVFEIRQAHYCKIVRIWFKSPYNGVISPLTQPHVTYQQQKKRSSVSDSMHPKYRQISQVANTTPKNSWLALSLMTSLLSNSGHVVGSSKTQVTLLSKSICNSCLAQMWI